MGALTLKSLPFEIRSWDIEKFESIDPTDSFGTNVRVYLNKTQIIIIESSFNLYNFNTWITDKARQFFDAIFKTWALNDKILLENNFWVKLFLKIIKTIYIFEHCNKQTNKNYSCKIICNNLSNEIFSLLLVLAQAYSFITLRQPEPLKTNTDLEVNFQLNESINKIKLDTATLCLLVATNPKHEGYYLNLTLRQRFWKGNFKCFSIGALINLTFSISFLGSNAQIIKSIVEGNNFICQNLKSSINPFLIYNNETLKQSSNKSTLKAIKALLYSNIFNKTWNGLNTLNSSLTDTGQFSLQNIAKLKLKDLNNFSALYFWNVSINGTSNLKRIINLKLLKQSTIKNIKLSNAQLVLNQTLKLNTNLKLLNRITKNYSYIPSSTFYENEETYISTEGFIKRTTKLILKKKSKSNWLVLQKILNHLKFKLVFLTRKHNKVISFNSHKLYHFKNFFNFQYYITQSLINLGFYLNTKNEKVVLNMAIKKFKLKSVKFYNTKLKYWLDNFFTGSKDEYSQNSITLNNCAKIAKLNSTNFF